VGELCGETPPFVANARTNQREADTGVFVLITKVDASGEMVEVSQSGKARDCVCICK